MYIYDRVHVIKCLNVSVFTFIWFILTQETRNFMKDPSRGRVDLVLESILKKDTQNFT